MKIIRKLPIFAIAAILWATPTMHAADPVFVEKGGVIVIEAESTSSKLGDWTKKTDVKDYSGECHIEFTGNKTESGPPKSPLKYHFKVLKAGKYTLSIRARKRLETKRADISNDCYVALKGDFASGGEAPLDVLKRDTKMFGGNADDWGWTRSLDDKHKKFPAVYDLKADEVYEFTMSGRSKNFNVDRFILVHDSKNLREVQKENPKESGTESASRPKERIKRTLTNQDGRSIRAELLGKDGKMLEVLVNGRKHEIEISTLSKDDQKFIEGWEP